MIEEYDNKIKYSINAMISGTACNFDCSYCYRKAQAVKEKNIPSHFKYPVEHMVKALSPKRLGGLATFVVIGGGETLLHPDIVPFVQGLLNSGHIVELVTNLTLNNRIDELINTTPHEDLKRLIVKASLHYNELIRLNKVDDYFTNMKKIISSGASSFPFIVVSEEYLPVLDDIKELCIDKVGIEPQITAELDFTFQSMAPKKFYTKKVKKELMNKFSSKIYRIFDKFLQINPRKHFCYAGEWSLLLNTSNGCTSKCYYSPIEQNIFENIDKPIEFGAIGTNCCIGNCALPYNLTAHGVIPKFKDIPPYGDVLHQDNCVNETVRKMLNTKFYKLHPLYTKDQEAVINKTVKKKFYPKNYLKRRFRKSMQKLLRNKLKNLGII